MVITQHAISNLNFCVLLLTFFHAQTCAIIPFPHMNAQPLKHCPGMQSVGLSITTGMSRVNKRKKKEDCSSAYLKNTK